MTKSLSVGILGSTGAVGQKLVKLLSGHPWFRVSALAGSPRSEGKLYGEAARWIEPGEIPSWAMAKEVVEPTPDMGCDLVFSALDASTAEAAEPVFVAAGIPVFSNAKSFRMDPEVPLLVPEVNPDHIDLLRDRGPGEGFIVANPNCSTTGLVLTLKPLADAFPLRTVSVTTLQALSGAGYPGVPSLEALGNVLPSIPGEVEKLETEPLKILGSISESSVELAPIRISAQTNRVPVLDGHLLSVSVGFDQPVEVEEARRVFETFRSPLDGLGLPSAPARPIVISADLAFPQPRLHSGLENGMAVAVGQLRTCPVLDLRFVALVHNTVRGAAGGAILAAELAKGKGLVTKEDRLAP